MAVLAVIALTALTLVALLGMLLVTMRLSANQERNARELRAADGAVTAAVNHLRITPATGNDPCTPGVPASGLPVGFDNGSNGSAGTPNVSGDDIEIIVRCTESLNTDPPTNAGGEAKLLGTGVAPDNYNGSVPWSTNCVTPTSTGCFPWQAALGAAFSPGVVSGIRPGLIHSGPDSLEFNSNVLVRGGAAVLRNPATGPSSTPAVVVSGKYSQGDPGPLGTGTSCGILSGGSVVAAAEIDSPEQVECGSAEARAGVAETPSYRINPVDRQAPPCTPGPVVTLRPGRYDRNAVAQLNALFGGACPNKTFHFVRETVGESGSFWFDANTTGAPASSRNALILNDPTSKFVFGAPNGWSAASGAPDSAFPKACDINSPGSSIVLSGRTELRHLGGRVSICPDVNEVGTPLAAVLQEPAVPHHVTVSPLGGDFAPLASLVSGDAGNVAKKEIGCSGTLQNSLCMATASFSVTTSTPGTATMKSARIGLRGGEFNPVNLIQSRTVAFTVTPSAQSGFATCTTPKLNGFTNNNQTASYELLSGGCASLNNERALDGAKITASIEYGFTGLCFFFDCPRVSETLRLFDVSVQTGAVYATAAPGDVTAAPADWVTPEAAALDDTAATRMFAAECLPIFGDGICDYLPPTARPNKARALRLANLKVDTSGAVTDGSSVESLSALVRYTRQGTIPSSGAATKLEFTLQTPGGNCVQSYTGVANFTHDVSFDLFGQSGRCGGVIQTVKDLQSSTLTLKVEPECTVEFQFGAWRCLGAIQPQIQHVALMVTTDSYHGPVPTSVVSIDPDSGRSMNVYGTTFMRGSAVDLHWMGSVTRDPVFNGNLVLNSLASDMTAGSEAGLVCCNSRSDDRHLTLDATIGTGASARTLLRVSAILRKNGTVTIVDWKICSADVCA
ncbi:MAG: hypothetical protein WBF71_05425 [Microthrixaceae bacterium]